MKNFLFGIALVFSVMVFATGFDNTPDSKELTIGSSMPAIKIANSAKSIDLGESTGHFTLLTFWESTDADSRSACNKYQKYFASRNQKASDIEYVAINLDKNSVLFDEIIKIDNLDADNQYRIGNFNIQQLQAAFNLEAGLGSVLIAPDSRIIAFNPTVEQLDKL